MAERRGLCPSLQGMQDGRRINPPKQSTSACGQETRDPPLLDTEPSCCGTNMANAIGIDFTPSVYAHAAALIGETPWRVSRDPELLFRAHAEAFRRYEHAPVTVGIDIYNLEAEAYGAIVGEPPGNSIPVISTHPCSGSDDIRALKPFNPEMDGRVPLVIETGKRLVGVFPDADIRIPVSGPVSLAGNLVGFDRLLCDIMDNPQSVSKALDHLARGQVAFIKSILSQGVGIALFESGATPPLLSPTTFKQIEQPVLTSLVTEASHLAGRPVPCIIGGNTLPVLDSILNTGCGYAICPYETDQVSFMQHMKAYPDVMVRINTDPYVFAAGDLPAVHSELDRVLRLAGNRRNVCIGTGALPFETDPNLVHMAKEFIRNRTQSGPSTPRR